VPDEDELLVFPEYVEDRLLDVLGLVYTGLSCGVCVTVPAERVDCVVVVVDLL